jgi:phosphatidate cytidylyltransferase
MLKQRVITATVLMCVLLPALFLSMAWPFLLLTLVLMAAAGWEWGRLNGAGALSLPIGVLLAGSCATALWVGWRQPPPNWVWWLTSVTWLFGGFWVLRSKFVVWLAVPMLARCILGVVLLWVAWLALVAAKFMGVNFILSVFCLVWVADIAAYFGGKTLGKHKLAITISPGKSWEGVWSGMFGALCLAAIWLWADESFKPESLSFYTRVHTRLGWSGLIISVLFLTAMSVVGDLFESFVKRAAGAKDSSHLLPGHGGVLDRVDALLPVFPLALALVL